MDFSASALSVAMAGPETEMISANFLEVAQKGVPKCLSVGAEKDLAMEALDSIKRTAKNANDYTFPGALL